MNRYKKTFNQLKKRKEKALIPFVVAGDPNYNTSLSIVKTLIDSGADVLELGLSFSDPIADGPTIQSADVRAKKVNTDRFFKFTTEIRKFNNTVPIGILVYANLVYQRGIDKFYKDAKKAGIDSVLITDLPVEETTPYIKAARKTKVDTVFIVSPLTSNERLKNISKKARGFIYVVSRLGVTGVRKELQDGTLGLLRRIRPKTKIPLCVGFGISKPEHIKTICKSGANGVIVGSAVVKIIEKNLKNKKLLLSKLESYMKYLKKATR
ncbi:MAG: tryptophan synthase subunit alpha [Nanoarchaeota archaeon]|nr:tryptophan synthase subunit alpha [Nanoarchaeota archaeon]